MRRSVASYLKLNCRVRNADPDALMKMAEAGLLLFILDGFDEMTSRATNDTMRLNIEQFEELANIRRNKVLLTTRPEYFLNLYQEQQVLQAYLRLYIQPLDKEQVNNYLQKRVPLINTHEGDSKKDWTYYRQQIDRIHDLTDLVRRPVLLEMVIRTLPLLVTEGESINRPNLYQRYLEGELDRQIIKQRRDLLIDREKRFEIMERIAVELYRTDKTELTSYRILEVSKELLTAEQQEEMEGSLREIVTCSFLIRTGNEYRFSHQSFLEYLVARRLAKDIMNDKLENLQLKLLTLTIRDFLSELERELVQGTSSTADTHNTNVSFDRKRLEAWYRGHPRDRWLSTNAISLLARIPPRDQLLKLPLEKADLTAVDLHGTNLYGVNLTGTDLTTANLTAANLALANLTLANLTSANLSHANLEGARLEGAKLERANLERAKLERAKLIQANLRDTNLVRADLSGADLSGADLFGTNLSGANLFGANLLRIKNLEDADLFGVNLEGTHLDKATRRKLRKRA